MFSAFERRYIICGLERERGRKALSPQPSYPPPEIARGSVIFVVFFSPAICCSALALGVFPVSMNSIGLLVHISSPHHCSSSIISRNFS